MISPAWAAVALSAVVQLLAAGALIQTVRTLVVTVAKHERKIDRNEKALILITPEPQRGAVLSLLSEEPK